MDNIIFDNRFKYIAMSSTELDFIEILLEDRWHHGATNRYCVLIDNFDDMLCDGLDSTPSPRYDDLV